MNITRNTKIYKATSEKGNEVLFRTLSVTELTLVDRIESIFHKNEMAYEIAAIEKNRNLNYFEIQQIGKDVINASMMLMGNDDLFELTIDELRASVKTDPILTIISNIIGVIPNVSLEYLLTLTYEDLLELGVFCEELTNKKIFKQKTATTRPTQDVEIKENKSFFKEDGKSLQDKMKELGDF